MKTKQKENNGLTFARILIIAMGEVYRLRTLTIPVDGVKGDELFPSPLLKGDTKYFLQKIPILKGNFWTVMSCNQNKHYVRQQ